MRRIPTTLARDFRTVDHRELGFPPGGADEYMRRLQSVNWLGWAVGAVAPSDMPLAGKATSVQVN